MYLVYKILIGLLVFPLLMGACIFKPAQDIRALESALNLYMLDCGNYPSMEKGLKELLKPTNEKCAKRYMDKIPIDPWGNKYGYRYPGTKEKSYFDLYSFGVDRIENTNDDIGNWQLETGGWKKHYDFECDDQGSDIVDYLRLLLTIVFLFALILILIGSFKVKRNVSK